MMSEVDPRRVLITPAVQQAGWGVPVWRMAAVCAALDTVIAAPEEAKA